MRDFDDLFSQWEPTISPRLSRAIDLLNRLRHQITPTNWMRGSLHGEGRNGQWAGCLLGHIHMLYGGPIESTHHLLKNLIYDHREVEEAIDALATCVLRIRLGADYQYKVRNLEHKGAWRVENWCEIIAYYNDSAYGVDQIHALINDAIRHLYDKDSRPHHDMHQRHVVDRLLEEEAIMVEPLPLVIGPVAESGKYPPINSAEEDSMVKVIPLPDWDPNIEFAEVLSKEPIAA